MGIFSDKKVVLVIVPTYNRVTLLPGALESALDQDYPHLRIVVVDDGSTDETARLCAKYAEDYPGRILYRYKENGGCASARNAGLETIDDEVGYVCFLDSDDRFLPGKLAREVALLEAHPEAGFSYSDSVVHEEETQKEEVWRAAAAGSPDRFAIEHFLTLEAKTSSVLYRVDTVRNRRYREDLRYNEDSDFLQKIALECRGVYSPEPGSWVRSHPGSKSRNLFEINKAIYRSYVDILRAYPDFYHRHTDAIDHRMEQIRKPLFQEMIDRRLYGEAGYLAKTLTERLVAAFRLGGYYEMRRMRKSLSRKLRFRKG